MQNQNIKEYLDSVEKKLSKRKNGKTLFSEINFPLAYGQCIYISDFKNQRIAYQKGITELLGYTEEEFDFFLVVNYFHPDDVDVVRRIIKATLMFATDNNVTEGVGFYLCCRIKHKNGNYIKVLRQSNVIQTDENGSIISNFSLLTDMSFLNLSNKVEWRFECPGLDKEKFRKYVVKEYKGFFSARELEIISELKQGLKSEQIARKLHISKHTVDTHRRKVLKKASCKNTVELLNFCFQNVLL